MRYGAWECEKHYSQNNKISIALVRAAFNKIRASFELFVLRLSQEEILEKSFGGSEIIPLILKG